VRFWLTAGAVLLTVVVGSFVLDGWRRWRLRRAWKRRMGELD